jgi:hypothetical protein
MSTAGHTFDGIPIGAYDVSITTQCGMEALFENGTRETAIEVGPTPAEVVVDAGSLATVILEVSYADESPYYGPLSVNMLEVDPQDPRKPGNVSDFVFSNAPYKIQNVPLGYYAIWVRQPRTFSPTGEELPKVRVEAGQTARMTFIVK